MRPALLLLALASTACGLAAPRAGTPVTADVARAVFEVRASGTDLVPTTVLYPAHADGTPRPGPHPAVVFIQGGFVATGRYEWLAEQLAQRGFVVALPENLLGLAFFSVDFGQAARRLLAEPPPGSLLEGLVDPARVAVAGHSLGSVVATKLALSGGFAAVALQAGYPDGADVPRLPGLGVPSLSLAGAGDCQAKEAPVREGWARLPGPSALVVLEGVSHFQFTRDDAEDVRRGCPPAAALGDAHARIVQAMTAFLDDALRGGGVGEAGLRAVPGATVEVR